MLCCYSPSLSLTLLFLCYKKYEILINYICVTAQQTNNNNNYQEWWRKRGRTKQKTVTVAPKCNLETLSWYFWVRFFSFLVFEINRCLFSKKKFQLKENKERLSFRWVSLFCRPNKLFSHFSPRHIPFLFLFRFFDQSIDFLNERKNTLIFESLS